MLWSFPIAVIAGTPAGLFYQFGLFPWLLASAEGRRWTEPTPKRACPEAA